MLPVIGLGILVLCMALTPWLERWLPRFWTWATGAIPLGLAIAFLVQGVDPAVVSLPWASELGVELAFRSDGLGRFFAVLVTGIGAAIMPYAGGYLEGSDQRVACRTWLLAFMAAMLGVVLSDNLILLYVFWELTGIASFMLIGIKPGEQSRAAAQQALLVTAAGGLALLVGLLLLAQAADTWSLAVVIERADRVVADPLYLPILILVLLGAATKSALFPFQSWLPQAMAAPTPVSAYLHSATMVKAGIYLLARMQPVLSGDPRWTWCTGAIGGATLAWGAIHVLAATDLKRLLAWSTVAALGLMALLLAFPSAEATAAACAFILAHALYKATMFMVAGSVDHGTGSRDAGTLRGVGRRMPLTWTAGIVGGLSLAGVPPLLGFIGKEQALGQALDVGGWLPAALVVVGGASFAFAALVTGWEIFAGRAEGPAREAHESSAPMLAGMWSLAAAGLVSGLWPGGIQALVDAATAGLHHGETGSKLELWHGFNLPLLLSLVALLLGLGAYLARGLLRRAAVLTREPGLVYRGIVSGLKNVAWHQTRLVQNGSLRSYLTIVLLVTAGLVAIGVGLVGLGRVAVPGPVGIPDLIILLVILGGASIAALTRSRVGGAVALGVMGTGTALAFLAYSAPDLALAQILADVLTVILFVLVFRSLPDNQPPISWARRGHTGVIALLGGGAITLLLLTVETTGSKAVAEWYGNHALDQGHGHNVVNVILVDFRALDTLGEITVLGIAAIGVIALVIMRRESCPMDDDPERGQESDEADSP